MSKQPFSIELQTKTRLWLERVKGGSVSESELQICLHTLALFTELLEAVQTEDS